jgi:hypothetical protein
MEVFSMWLLIFVELELIRLDFEVLLSVFNVDIAEFW